MAATDSLIVGETPDIEEYLSGLNVALDHPIKRSAVEKIVSSPRDHARVVEMLGIQTLLAPSRELALDPFLEIVDRIATNTELDEIERHRPSLNEIIGNVNSLPENIYADE